MADVVYACDGGAFLTLTATEARVNLSKEDRISISLPFVGAWDHFAAWSPRGGSAVSDEDYAVATP